VSVSVHFVIIVTLQVFMFGCVLYTLMSNMGMDCFFFNM
jgi:hypothetical protein